MQIAAIQRVRLADLVGAVDSAARDGQTSGHVDGGAPVGQGDGESSQETQTPEQRGGNEVRDATGLRDATGCGCGIVPAGGGLVERS